MGCEQASESDLGVKAGPFDENISSNPSGSKRMKQIPCQRNDQKRKTEQTRAQHCALL